MGNALFWVNLASKAQLVPLAVAGVSGLLLFWRLPLALRYLAVLLWIGLLIEAVAAALQSKHLPNLFLIPIDAAGELWLLSLVYAQALQSAVYSRWRPWVAGTFVLYAALSSWLVTDPAQFRPALMVGESLLALLLPGLYFRKLLNELHVRNLGLDAMFWVSAGLLLYFLGKLLIGLFSNYLLRHYSMELNMWVWFVHAVLLFVLYSCYLRALWLRPQK